MLHHDPLFIEAEIAYRREQAAHGVSRWELERPHPVRDAVRRWRHALTGAGHEAASPAALSDAASAPHLLRQGAAAPDGSGNRPASTQDRALEHTRA